MARFKGRINLSCSDKSPKIKMKGKYPLNADYSERYLLSCDSASQSLSYTFSLANAYNPPKMINTASDILLNFITTRENKVN